jgi:hypothetical protein
MLETSKQAKLLHAFRCRHLVSDHFEGTLIEIIFRGSRPGSFQGNTKIVKRSLEWRSLLRILRNVLILRPRDNYRIQLKGSGSSTSMALCYLRCA